MKCDIVDIADSWYRGSHSRGGRGSWRMDRFKKRWVVAGLAALTLGLGSGACVPDDRSAGAGDEADAGSADAAHSSDAPLEPSSDAPTTPVPESCTNGQDDDLDGQTDCMDSECTGQLACALPPCPAGQTALALAAGGLTIPIVDNTTVSSKLAVSGAGVVTRTAVRVTLSHRVDSDLDLVLRAPDGYAVDLSSDNGGQGDNYGGTIFVDAATKAVSTGTPPFAGAHRPEQPLATLLGRPAAGTWALEVTDDTLGDEGKLTDVALHLCVCTSCEAGAACVNGSDDDGDGQIDCVDPDCAAAPQCGAETQCTDTIDDDLDGKVDCADPDCATAVTCVPEAACGDGMDNDLDGKADCLDADCGPSCATESNCGDGLDNDADGKADCQDLGCSGALACTDPCPQGQTAVFVSPPGLPLSIADNSTQAATLMVSASGVVATVALRLTIQHGYAADLDIRLRSATNTTIDVSSDNGGGGDNYLGTVFVDSASTLVTAGTAPFAGRYRPEQPLSLLAGQVAQGTWKLEIGDDSSGQPGSLTEATLRLCVCTDCEVGATCVDGSDNDGDGALDCADPDCAGVVQCTPENACNDGVDNDLDGKTDCGDPDCAAAVICQPESSCTDGIDNNMNGLTDCSDPGCGATCAAESDCGDGTDNDGDGQVDCADVGCATTIACLEPCPPGQATIAVTAQGLPVAVPDTSTGTATFDVTAGGLVNKSAVLVSIAHGYVSDLDIGLRAPDGTFVELSSDNGGGGDNYTGTVFVDDTPTSITAGSPPFTGKYRPETPLATLNGRPSTGLWKLELADDASGDGGMLVDAQLRLCVCANCEAGAACSDGQDNDGDSQVDCADSDCSGRIQCQPESDCSDNVDNNQDGKTDCADDSCVAPCTAEVDCQNGLDDDGDGQSDCADLGCQLGGQCELAEQSCSDAVDNDGDGQIDCADASCAWACALPACAAGEALVVLGKAGPVAVADTATTDAPIITTRAGTVTRAAVTLTLDHDWLLDIDLLLVAPGGTSIVDLSSDNGGSGDDYVQTVFADSAATSITTGNPPFTGSFRPESPLAAAAPRALAGTWILRIVDDEPGFAGTLASWAAAFCVAP
jgi:subtilisin-like proprotein convertase family protein